MISSWPTNFLLYFYDTDNKVILHLKSYHFLSTVKDNKEYFITSKINGAEEDKKVEQEIGWPRTYHLKDIVSKQLLRNFKVTVDDISCQNYIWLTNPYTTR